MSGATPAVGVLLAAGAGRRMGTPKALLRDADGRPLLDTAVHALRAGGCGRIVVVLGARADEVQMLPGDDLAVVHADDWAEGMGASLRAGLQAASAQDQPADLAVVMLVDLPDVDAAVVRRVVRAAVPEGSAALARAGFAGRPGHPVVIGRDLWPEAARVATGDRGARDLFAAHPHRVVECGDLATGHDVDVPADLRRPPEPTHA